MTGTLIFMLYSGVAAVAIFVAVFALLRLRRKNEYLTDRVYELEQRLQMAERDLESAAFTKNVRAKRSAMDRRGGQPDEH